MNTLDGKGELLNSIDGSLRDEHAITAQLERVEPKRCVSHACGDEPLGEHALRALKPVMNDLLLGTIKEETSRCA